MRLPGSTGFTVCEGFDGTVTVLHQGKMGPCRRWAKGALLLPQTTKSVHHTVAKAQRPPTQTRDKPGRGHPWNRDHLAPSFTTPRNTEGAIRALQNKGISSWR